MAFIVVFRLERVNLLAPELFFSFSTLCIYKVNNTGTKYVRIMKKLHFEEEKKESIYQF